MSRGRYLRTHASDSTTRMVATEALDKLGVYSHLSLLQLVHIQGLAPLRYLGGCADVRAQRTAASVLASLLEDDEARLDIVRGDGFRTVLSLVRAPPPAARPPLPVPLYPCHATDTPHRAHSAGISIDVGGEFARVQATSGDDYIQTVASIAVDNLPIANVDLVRIVEEGSLPSVASLISSPKTEFRAFATTVVCNVVALESFACEDCSLYPITGRRLCISNACGNINLCQPCARLRGPAAMAQMQQIAVTTGLRERVVTDGGHTALIGLVRAGIAQIDPDRGGVGGGGGRGDDDSGGGGAAVSVGGAGVGDVGNVGDVGVGGVGGGGVGGAEGAASITALQSLAVKALASLAFKSSHAAEINRQGGIAMLVELLSNFQLLTHFHMRVDNALVVLRSATRALANLACCARQGTWQGDAIATSILAARALQPLLVLTLHQDVEVVRHTARVLAELASVCVSAEDTEVRAAAVLAVSPSFLSALPPHQQLTVSVRNASSFLYDWVE
jgi:hypothetical protein